MMKFIILLILTYSSLLISKEGIPEYCIKSNECLGVCAIFNPEPLQNHQAKDFKKVSEQELISSFERKLHKKAISSVLDQMKFYEMLTEKADLAKSDLVSKCHLTKESLQPLVLPSDSKSLYFTYVDTKMSSVREYFKELEVEEKRQEKYQVIMRAIETKRAARNDMAQNASFLLGPSRNGDSYLTVQSKIKENDEYKKAQEMVALIQKNFERKAGIRGWSHLIKDLPFLFEGRTVGKRREINPSGFYKKYVEKNDKKLLLKELERQSEMLSSTLRQLCDTKEKYLHQHPSLVKLVTIDLQKEGYKKEDIEKGHCKLLETKKDPSHFWIGAAGISLMGAGIATSFTGLGATMIPAGMMVLAGGSFAVMGGFETAESYDRFKNVRGLNAAKVADHQEVAKASDELKLNAAMSAVDVVMLPADVGVLRRVGATFKTTAKGVEGVADVAKVNKPSLWSKIKSMRARTYTQEDIAAISLNLGITPDEFKAIRRYSTISSEEINGCLRVKKCNPEEAELVRNMLEGFKKLSSKNGELPTVLYRGVNNHFAIEGLENALKAKNGGVVDNAFLSTSRNVETAEFRAALTIDGVRVNAPPDSRRQAMMVIKPKQGSKNVVDLKGISPIEGEEEFLYAPATKFIVTKDKTPNSAIYYLEEIE